MGRASIEKEEFWRFVLSEQSGSGQSVREFCRQEDVSEASFYQWRKKLGLTPKPASPEFLPIKVVPSSPSQLDADNDRAGCPSARTPSDSASRSAALQIMAPSGFSIHVTQAATPDLILQTLVAFERLAREPKLC
jgi:hypothetical protein